jgi:hypothetical protein
MTRTYLSRGDAMRRDDELERAQARAIFWSIVAAFSILMLWMAGVV